MLFRSVSDWSLVYESNEHKYRSEPVIYYAVNSELAQHIATPFFLMTSSLESTVWIVNGC